MSGPSEVSWPMTLNKELNCLEQRVERVFRFYQWYIRKNNPARKRETAECNTATLSATPLHSTSQKQLSTTPLHSVQHRYTQPARNNSVQHRYTQCNTATLSTTPLHSVQHRYTQPARNNSVQHRYTQSTPLHSVSQKQLNATPLHSLSQKQLSTTPLHSLSQGQPWQRHASTYGMWNRCKYVSATELLEAKEMIGSYCR